MLRFIKHIISRMLEIHKWAWRVLFPLWASFTIASALTYISKHYLIALFLLLLSVICLIVAIITLVYHIKDARIKDKEIQKEKDFQALKEAFKRTGMSDKESEIAARGR